ncbi:TIGR04283 family arsenosugar biosynthesis glycosyltransferase [Thioalkalivibrio sp.]|uniref:TIGR04283 family arsenosugar biosynthesis glycosyltransferase n=1 Tax=Thioalkalivibrio sp. TaxID=2093813 RepID=UPI0039757553
MPVPGHPAGGLKLPVSPPSRLRPPAVDALSIPPRLSIIIPCLNESVRLPRLLNDLAALRKRGHEIIVVDGGSGDGTLEQAAQGADRTLNSPAGRARQMNAGAAAARGDAFWFLHADTRVPRSVPAGVLACLRAGRPWGRCRVRLSGDTLVLRAIAALMNLRSCLTGIATGDQGIFVTRSAFDGVGGFPEIALMEDVAISRALKSGVGRPACIRPCLVTSSRRWEQRGVWRTVLLMWRLRLAYWLGADPAELARRYR